MKRTTIVAFLLPLGVILVLHFYLTHTLFWTDPPIHPDETYFADIANELMNTGTTKTTLFDIGIGQQHIRAYGYPPLYYFFLAVALGIKGFSIETVRLTSVILSTISICLLYYSCLRITKSTYMGFLCTLMLVSFGPFGIASRIGRMEILIIFFVMTSLVLHTKHIFSKKEVILSSIIGTLAWVTHPLGILVSIVAFGTALLHKHTTSWRTRLNFFVIPFVIGTVIWGLLYMDRFDLFIQQIVLQFTYKSDRASILTILFQHDWYWRIYILLYLTLITITFLVGFHKKQKAFIGSALIGWITLSGVYVAKEQWYLVYLVLPILVMLLVWWKLKKLVAYGLILVFILFQNISLWTFIRKENELHKSFQSFVNSIEQRLPKNTHLLISSLPDPTIELRRRGFTNVRAIPHVTTSGTLKPYMLQHEYLLVNVISNQDLKSLLNTESYVGETFKFGGYEYTLIQLK